MPTLFPPVASPVSPISDWVRLPAGSFQMGGLETDKFVSAVELPRHEVTFTRAFHMTPHPVTRAQWLHLMPAPIRQDQNLSPELPIVGISWDDAMDYGRRLSDATGVFHRLPSEAEWEVLTPRLEQAFGVLWQWTASPYRPYPGFAPAAGAVGE